MAECIFCKIRDREIPKEFTYEDKDLMVFPDIHPIKPIHLLVVPKEHIEDFLELNDMKLFSRIKNIIDKMVKNSELDKKGYRISVNGGGAQAINHLHFHVLGPVKNTEM